MDRRDFTRGLTTAALATPFIIRPGDALATTKNQDDKDFIEARARIVLQIAAITVLVNWFLIASQSRIFGIDLRREVPQSVASRADVSKVPLLGSLFKQTIGAEFAAAQYIGPIYLLNKTLILLPTIILTTYALSVTLTHRNRVYEPPGKLKSMKLSQSLDIPALSGQRPVGRGAVEGRNLLLSVTPSIFDGKRFEGE